MSESFLHSAAALGDANQRHYEQCARQGVRYASAILKNRCDAEEAVQETFVRLHKIEPAENEAEFKGKFFRTLRNHCIDLIRRGRIKKEVQNDGDWIDREQSVLKKIECDETLTAIEQAMQELPANWRQVLQLRVFGRLTYQEIAQATECNDHQVRTWIYRGRRQMEERLKSQGIIQ